MSFCVLLRYNDDSISPSTVHNQFEATIVEVLEWQLPYSRSMAHSSNSSSVISERGGVE